MKQLKIDKNRQNRQNIDYLDQKKKTGELFLNKGETT
jgi:hypothetical protein